VNIDQKESREIHDIIIIGSGPAGISTALHLLKNSPHLAEHMLVLECAKHPREKLCAGGMLNDGDYILERLGLNCSEVPHIEVSEARFQFEGRGISIKRDPQSFKVFRRREFDHWLVIEARKRGIRIEEEIQVLSIDIKEQGVAVKTNIGNYFSKLIVGADGANSLVQRSIGKNSSQSMALELMTEPAQSEEFKQGFFDFSAIVEDVQGYVWRFPAIEGGKHFTTRGIYDARVIPRPRKNLKEVLHDYLIRDELKLDDYEIKGKPIRFFNPNNTFSAPRVLLVGDAAGVDPIYGEGISFALGYGEVAAEEINDAFIKEEFSFSNYRERILKQPMGRCLVRRLWVARLLYRFKNRPIQRLLWWRLGFVLKWYIEHRLIDWAKK